MTTPASARIDQVMNAMPGVGSGPTSITSAPCRDDPRLQRALQHVARQARVLADDDAPGAILVAEALRHRLPQTQRHLGGHRIAVGDAADAVGAEQLSGLVGHGSGKFNHGPGPPRQPRRRAPARRRGRAPPPRRRGRGRHRRRRPELPLAGRLAGELPDERLARNADHERHADPRAQRRQRPQQRQVVLDPLAEADPRIGPDLAAARSPRRRDPLLELVADLADDVVEGDLLHHRRRLAAQVPEHDRRARLRRHLEDRRIEQPPEMSLTTVAPAASAARAVPAL